MPLVESVVPVTPVDDLTVIEGIGPKIVESLNAGGVMTFGQLAASSPADIAAMLGPMFAVHDPTTWPQQAQMAATGQWDELKAWQDQLVGGKDAQPVPDDLKIIEGIGPKIEEIFHAAGILTWKQLASTDTAEMRKILDAQGMALHDPTTWPQQAQMAADGRMDELMAWQNELDGGRT